MANLVAYYSGATTTATLPDESGNNNDAALIGGAGVAAGVSVPGPSAIRLAYGDYIDLPGAAVNPLAWTVSFWCLPNTANLLAYPVLFSYTDTVNIFSALSYVTSSNSWRLYVDYLYEQLVGPYPLPTAATLFVVIYDGAAMTLYVDGIEYAKVNKVINYAPTFLRLAAHSTSPGADWDFPGDYAEIGLWDGALSAAEVTDLLTKTPAELAGGGTPVSTVPQATHSVPATYRLTLTGAPDATTDLLLPCVSLQARLRSGSQSYFSAVLPYPLELATGLAARPNGDLVLEHISDSNITIITVPLDSVQPIKGVNSASINITGWRQSTNNTPDSHDVQPITTTSGANGKRNWSCEDFNPNIRPADTINFDSESVIIDTMTLQISIGREAVQYSEA